MAASEQDTIRRTLSSHMAMSDRFKKELAQERDAKKKDALYKKIQNVEQEISALNHQLKSLSPVERKPITNKFEDMTGQDWLSMSDEQKQIFVFTGIGGLERQGVFITRPPQDYIAALDKLMVAEPLFQKDFLDSLFVFCVYDGEPQTRVVIDRIRQSSMGDKGYGKTL